jgi:putative zinc finger/helix-turn-helix YgiT family protein
MMPYAIDVKHDGQLYHLEIPELKIPRCRACGELIFSNSVDDQISQALRAHLRLMTPEQIRGGREELGLKSKELAEKLGVAAETISRWEGGGLIQSRAMDNFLRVYFAVPDVRGVLQGAEQDPSLGTTVNGGRAMNSTGLDAFTPEYAENAEQVFLRPGVPYRWYEIVNGVDVRRENGSTERMCAVDGDTVRGLHRVRKDKDLPRPKETFQRYFIEQQDRLLRDLFVVSSREELHQLLTRICDEVRDELRSNIKPDRLASYNRVRKPVDLYLEHLVAMSFELEERRQLLVPLLYLPLDSWMFQSPHLFTERELAEHGLDRSSKFGDVKDEKTYQALQRIVDRRAGEVSRKVGKPFWPIYFDLLWNNRFRSRGCNLFQTNPDKNRRCG